MQNNSVSKVINLPETFFPLLSSTVGEILSVIDDLVGIVLSPVTNAIDYMLGNIFDFPEFDFGNLFDNLFDFSAFDDLVTFPDFPSLDFIEDIQDRIYSALPLPSVLRDCGFNSSYMLDEIAIEQYVDPLLEPFLPLADAVGDLSSIVADGMESVATSLESALECTKYENISLPFDSVFENLGLPPLPDACLSEMEICTEFNVTEEAVNNIADIVKDSAEIAINVLQSIVPALGQTKRRILNNDGDGDPSNPSLWYILTNALQIFNGASDLTIEQGLVSSNKDGHWSFFAFSESTTNWKMLLRSLFIFCFLGINYQLENVCNK